MVVKPECASEPGWLAGPTLGGPGPAGFGWSPRICILSNRFPGDADAAGLWTTRRNHWSRAVFLSPACTLGSQKTPTVAPGPARGRVYLVFGGVQIQEALRAAPVIPGCSQRAEAPFPSHRQHCGWSQHFSLPGVR